MRDTGGIGAEGPVGDGFCACGCGRRTAIATRTQVGLGHVRGEPVRFLPGHARRGRKLALERLGRRFAGGDVPPGPGWGSG
jgi:hypothetical protein